MLSNLLLFSRNAPSYPENPPEEDEKEIPDVTASLAAARKTSTDASAGAVFTEFDRISILKEEHRKTLKAFFLGGHPVFALLPTGSEHRV